MNGYVSTRARFRCHISAVILGILLSVFVEFGRVIEHSEDGYSLDIVELVILTLFFWILIEFIYWLLDETSNKAVNQDLSDIRHRIYSIKHPLLTSSLIMAICMLPYVLAFFPGSLSWDATRSLNQFFTDDSLENHHPVLFSAVYSAVYYFGRSIGNMLAFGEQSVISPDNIAVFMLVMIQLIATAFAFGGIVSSLIKLKAPFPFVIISLVFLSFWPIWGSFVQVVMKDSLYTAILTGFIVAIARLLLPELRDNRSIQPWMWASAVALGILGCLFRNNGVFIVMPTLIGASLLIKGWRVFGSVVIVAAAYILTTSFIYPFLGVDMSTTQKEALSIPFQQTARYVSEYADEVTEEEKSAIDAVLPYELLSDLYIPDLSDPVKDAYKLNNSEIEGSKSYAESHPDALKEYLKVWLSMGLKHPDCYLEATVANTYAYFYPLTVIGPEINRTTVHFYIQGEPINQGTYNPHYVLPEEIRTGVSAAIKSSVTNPWTQWIWSPAPYVWAMLLAWFYIAHFLWRCRKSLRYINIATVSSADFFGQCEGTIDRGANSSKLDQMMRLAEKKRMTYVSAILLVPGTMMLLTALAGPVNGHLRYIMPCIPTLLMVFGVLMSRESCTMKTRDDYSSQYYV